MTVSYNLDVSSVGSFTFLKLLGRWKGSIFKSVYWELIGWSITYFLIHLIYRFLLTEEQQKEFERISLHLDIRLAYIPLTFMLGFFVTCVIDRWRNILINMSFIDNCALSISTLIRGVESEARLIRRSIVRYLVLAQVLLFRDISMRVRRRFPNMESLIDAGFLMEDELETIENFNFPYNKYWMPINWANTLVARSTFSTENHVSKPYIDCPASMNQVLTVIREYRLTLDAMCKYDWAPIPIAYPQVVFLAVRSYFVICLVSRQFSIHDTDRKQVNLYFPLMTILEFIFFVGWMKVAEALLNPLGEDDDDLECNWLIDKNIATGMAIVDDHHDCVPKVKLDAFADPCWQPVYSEDSVPEAPVNRGGSVAHVEFPGAHERVKMIHVEPQKEPIHKTSDVGILRRKLTTAFYYRPRANSVNPVAITVVPQKRLSDASTRSNALSRLDEERESKSSDSDQYSEISTEIDRKNDKRK